MLSLLSHLESEHDSEKHLYRGQLARHTHDWVDADSPIKLESIYPSDYRFITAYSDPHTLPFANIVAARSRGRIIRDTFVTALTAWADTDDPAWSWLKDDLKEMYERLAWLNAQLAGGRTPEEVSKTAEKDISLHATGLYRLFWSLAQHYLIATALTDVTFSPRVAGWFATQPWDANVPLPTEGSGVIYRFDRPCLETVLQEQTAIMVEHARRRGDARPPDLFLVDIRRIPKEFAGRPTGQAGGSVYGFDQPTVLKAIVDKCCLEIFEFRHSTKAENLSQLRASIVPDHDPFADMATRVRETIDSMFKANVIATSRDGQMVDSKGTQVLSALKLVARLTIEEARLVGRLPLGDEYTAYHFVDIKSSGSHGYVELLVSFNEKTNAVLGYVSLEPVEYNADKLPFKLLVTAAWFNQRRAVVDFGRDPVAKERFLERAMEVSRVGVGKDASSMTASGLSRIVASLGGLQSAEEVLKTLYEAGDIESGVNLGVLLVATGRPDEGVALLKRAVDQGSPDAAYNLGTIYQQRKNLREAEIYFRRALEMGDKEASYGLGVLFEVKGDWARAEEFYRRSHEVDGYQRATNNLAIALYKLGRQDEAKRYLELARDSGDELAAYNLASMFPEDAV